MLMICTEKVLCQQLLQKLLKYNIAKKIDFATFPPGLSKSIITHRPL